MSCFWAQFQMIGIDVFRYDTRIYLKSIRAPSENDICIGAIVGKNPGSAIANNLNIMSLQQINLDGDKLLPTVRNILLKSFNIADKTISSGEYVQVLNLFYLCDPVLVNAVGSISKYDSPMYCISESKKFYWIWYVWGGENVNLSDFKHRFKNFNTKEHFFFDWKTKSVSNHVPGHKDFARHTQGLSHKSIVPYISELVKNRQQNDAP